MSTLATRRLVWDRVRLFWLGYALLLVLPLLAGCRVAPLYVRPATPAPPVYEEAQGGVAMVEWRPAQPADVAARSRWWESYGDAELNALEEQVNISNQNIATAAANYAAAQAMVREARSRYWPTVGAAPAINRERTEIFTGTQPVSGTLTEYTMPVEATWEPDVWGRVRNTVHGAEFAAQVSAADLESVRLAAHAQLAMDYFALRAQDSLRQVLDDSVTSEQDTLALTRGLYQSGLATDEAVAAAEAQLQATQAAEENTGILRAQYAHAIALLVGKAPAGVTIAERGLEAQPVAAPLGVPADLLQRRPDIASAERAVAAANAQIGVARSAYFPSITLSASGGFTAFTAADWFSWPSRVWAAGPALAETVFDAGLRRATVQQYRAQYDAAVASYRQTTLTAFQQVEDQLAALRVLQGEMGKQQAAVDAAQRTLDEATVRYKAGLDPYLNVTQAQMTVLGYRQTMVGLRSQQMLASVQLLEALGGGWQSSELPEGKVLRGAR